MNVRADKAAWKAANTTIPYYNTKLRLDSLFIYLKQKIKHHWNNEWKTTIANHKKWFLQQRNTTHSKKTRSSRNIKNHYRTYENNTNLYSPKETNHSAIGEKDPNNRTPHITMGSTSKKVTPDQIYPKRQPKGQWNIIKPATIFTPRSTYEPSLLLLSLITHAVDAT